MVRAEAPPDSFPPLLSIFATVRAESLVHRTDPQVRIRFTGNATDTLHRTIRTNLPEDVQPGVVYRNVRAHFELRVAFDSLGAVLDSLLGGGVLQPAPPRQRGGQTGGEPR